MPSRSSSEHADAVTRRLQLLADTSAPVDEQADTTAATTVDATADATADTTAATRVAWDHGRSPVAPPDPGTPPPLPEPGRHAARQGRSSEASTSEAPGGRVLAGVPEQLRGHWALGSPQVVAVVLLAAVGLLVTAWWVLRAEPERVPLEPRPAAPLVSASPSPAAAGPPSGTASPAARARPSRGAEEQVVVHVAGDVRDPGIVTLPAGSRVVDAVERAGGAKPGVDLTTLNLARPLIDGEQIVVGAPRQRSRPGQPAATGTGDRISLNSAGQSRLEELPGVGPVTARAIIQWRVEHGGFNSVQELLEVSGIGDATLAEIAPHVTL